MSPSTSLRRTLSLPLVCLYGLGNILGAGVYVLIGKVAGAAGYYAPLAFLFAALIAAVTAFSFAELSSRYPLSAGEAVYIQKGFNRPRLSLLVGLLIILTGLVSAATIARGFVGYLDIFIALPDSLVIVALLLILGLVSVWGISESVSTAALFTLVELAGLILILFVTFPAFEEFPSRVDDFIPDLSIQSWSGIAAGAFLAFYAYVGFEDMVNVAEEVKNPSRNLPIAILLALGIATALYLLVAISSLLVMSPQQLNDSNAPLASIYETVTGNSPWLISAVSLIAVVNGALIQLIMASRVCYGLAKQNWLPQWLGGISPRTQTPVRATWIVVGATIVAALFLPIETLARSTSYLLLVVFSLVNVALCKIKLREPAAAHVFEVPIAVPILGFVLCAAFLLVQTLSWFG